MLEDAGILEARSVLLTTNDDAMNIYLAVSAAASTGDSGSLAG